MTTSRKVGRSRPPGGGLFGSDGSPVVPHRLRQGPFSDAYYYLVNAPWPAVLLLLAGIFFGANALFALGYLTVGGVSNAHPGSFADAFFFSVQTMGTIGYGTMAPQSRAANLLVTLEALTGGIGLALMTGLVFAKFSRPTSRVRFSKVAIISDYRGRKSLMFRMANERNERIVQPRLYIVMLRAEPEEGGGFFIHVHDLQLVRDRHAFLSLSWLVIHTINESSPLYGASADSLLRDRASVIVSLTGIDEGLSQSVYAHHSYGAQDIRWNATFVDMLKPQPDGGWTMDYSRFDDVNEPG